MTPPAYYLVVRNGADRGSAWPLTEKPLMLGRADSCDVVIRDLAVSRRHCEIAWIDGALRLRDLGSVNATFVNGRPTTEATLAEGDEITVGGASFVVVAKAPIEPPSSAASNQYTPLTLALSHVFSLENRLGESVRAQLPAGVAELQDLLVLGRMFGSAASVGELLDTLHWHVQERFAPGGLWMAWSLERGERLVPNPIDGAPGEPGQAPLEPMKTAVESGAGLLVPSRIRTAKGHRILTTLVAPLVAQGAPLGALAMRSEPTRPVFDENDLQYFVALAHTLAPYLRATAHHEQLHRDLEQARRQAGILPSLLGDSQVIAELRELIAAAARSSLHVLILGETGTGKELAARMVHDLSDRAGHPFLVVNCAAVPGSLFENEFFGHEKDSFTGAGQRHLGHFEQAHCGTLFLDEVGDLSLENQARILRAIETGSFYRVGGNQEIRVDVRVVAATNRFAGLPDKGAGFRADLYHRLNGFEIHMPPLRDHLEDLPLLVDHFLDEARRLLGRPVARPTVEVLDRLRSWSWPGNVRELRACIHRAAALARGGALQPNHIVLTATSAATRSTDDAVITLAEAEKRHITVVLRRMSGNIRATARALQISRDTLYNKIRTYNIEV
jgi:DNA-binding NtrC family response regulator